MSTDILSPHPYADKFPMLPEGELQELAESIRENGLRHPVVITADGLILDGRNRAAACERVGVTPETVVYEGDDLAEYVIDSNVTRRNMSTGARAMATALVLVADGKRSTNDKGRGYWLEGAYSPNLANSGAGMAQRLRECGTVLDWKPELAEAVINGDLRLDLAYQQAKDARNAVDAEKQRAAIEANRKREATIRERNLNTQRLEILTKENSPYLKQVEAGDMSIAAAHAAHLADTAREREEAAQAKRIAEQDARTLSEGMVAFQFLESPEARLRMLNHWNVAGAGVRPLALHATTPEHMRETATLLNQFATEWEKYQWHTNQS